MRIKGSHFDRILAIVFCGCEGVSINISSLGTDKWENRIVITIVLPPHQECHFDVLQWHSFIKVSLPTRNIKESARSNREVMDRRGLETNPNPNFPRTKMIT